MGGKAAFYQCTSLISVYIPASVTEIGGCAFCDCSSLQSVCLPKAARHLDRDGFDYCDKFVLFCLNNYASFLFFVGQSSSLIPKGTNLAYYTSQHRT